MNDISQIINKAYNFLYIQYKQIDRGTEITINGRIKYFGKKGRLCIGNNTIINSGPYYIPIGFSGYTSFWIMGDGYITIGNSCGISNVAFCSQSKIQIGNNVLIGGGVKIYDTDFHSLDYIERRNIHKDKNRSSDPVVIDDDVFIGAGSFILKGTHIGARSIIGAGSVVTGKIPSDEIWAGNPAKFIGKIKCYSKSK